MEKQSVRKERQQADRDNAQSSSRNAPRKTITFPGHRARTGDTRTLSSPSVRPPLEKFAVLLRMDRDARLINDCIPARSCFIVDVAALISGRRGGSRHDNLENEEKTDRKRQTLQQGSRIRHRWQGTKQSQAERRGFPRSRKLPPSADWKLGNRGLRQSDGQHHLPRCQCATLTVTWPDCGWKRNRRRRRRRRHKEARSQPEE